MSGLDQLKQWLLQVDEVQLLELLDVSAEDLLAAFEEKIISRRAYLEKEMEVLDNKDTDDDYSADRS